MENHPYDIDALFADDPEISALLRGIHDDHPAAQTAGSLAMQPERLERPEPPKPPPAIALSLEDVASPATQSLAKKLARILLNILFYTFCFGIVAGAAGMALSSDPQKSFLGYRFYKVLTPSMTPQADSPPGGFYAGDLIVTKLCPADEVEVGDIITFVPGQAAKSYLTHRVVDIRYERNGTPGIYFVTRGDANNADDPLIQGDSDPPMLIGKKVFSIRFAGAAIEFIRENTVLSLVFLCSSLLFIAVLRRYFTVSKKRR